MKISEAQAAVKRFHEKHNFPTDLLRRRETHPSDKGKLELQWWKAGLRRGQLCAEEGIAEFLEAWGNKDVLKMADALADTLFIVLGSAVVLGIEIEPILEEIIRSNATKKARDPNDFRLRDKGDSYEPPNLEPILKEQKLL